MSRALREEQAVEGMVALVIGSSWFEWSICAISAVRCLRNDEVAQWWWIIVSPQISDVKPWSGGLVSAKLDIFEF